MWALTLYQTFQRRESKKNKLNTLLGISLYVTIKEQRGREKSKAK